MALEIRDYLYAKGGLRYEISGQDTAGDPQYYGYLNNEGYWIIQKFSAAAGTYLYAQGTNSYSTYWANRAALLTFSTYDKLFAPNP